MSWYRVVAVNEDERPLAQVEIEAIDLTDRTTAAVQTTNRSGEALFTDLVGPHFFRVRNRRTSGEVGGRHYTGQVKVQIVGFDAGGVCIDFYVDPAGGGTHTTLAAAVAAAITAAGSTGTRTIYVCGSVTEGSIDIGGLGDSATIVIMSSDRNRSTIIAPLNQDIFVQSSTGGNTGGRLGFKDIGLDPDEANSRAILDINTTSEVINVTFENCHFAGNGGYILRQDGLDSLGQIQLRVEKCTGTLDGFYLVAGASATFSPDQVTLFNNILTLTRWWQFTGGVNADPNFARVIGGLYTITNGVEFTDGDQFHFSSFVLYYLASGPAFSTGAATQNVNDLTFSDIIVRFSNAGGTFGDFQSAAVNNNAGLFVKDIYGFPISGLVMTPGTTFLTVDTDYQSVHVGNFFGRGFTNQYSGPTSTEPATTCFGNDLLVTGFLRVGSCTTPTNTTDGDLTIGRLIIPNAAIPAGVRLVSIQDTYTPTLGAGAVVTGSLSIIPSLGAGAAADEVRGLAIQIEPRPTANYAGSVYAGYLRLVHDTGSFNINDARVTFQQLVQNLAGTTITTGQALLVSYRAQAGTIATAYGLRIERGAGGDAGTITTGVGIEVLASAGVTPTTDIAIRTLGGEHRFTGHLMMGADVAPVASIEVRGAIDSAAVRGVTNIRLGSLAGDPSIIWEAGAGGAMWDFRNSAGSLRLGRTNTSFDVDFETTGVEIANSLRVGGLTAPANTTAGDVTCVRLNVGNVAFPVGIEAYIGGDMQVTGQLELDGDLNHDGTNIGFFGTAPTTQRGPYTPTNVTTDRSYDANATTVDELADVLGTLIADLQAYGLLS